MELLAGQALKQGRALAANRLKPRSFTTYLRDAREKAEALETLKRALASGYANLNWTAKDSISIASRTTLNSTNS